MFTITGKVVAILAERSGVSKKTGNDWHSRDFVVQEVEGQYPQSLCVAAMGSRLENFNSLGIVVGDMVEVGFDLKATVSSSGDKWFNGASLARIQRVSDGKADGNSESVTTSAPKPSPAPANAVGNTNPNPLFDGIEKPKNPADPAPASVDDLPF